MTGRFADLKKVPREPAARMLAMAGAKLATPLKAPVSASVEAVLDELSRHDVPAAGIDMLRLLSIALPARERVWWGCLAAHDVIGGEVEKLPVPLAAAEKWVFKPTDENRAAARQAIDIADIDDDTTLCAVAVAMCDGKLGPGDMQQFDAPPGGASAAVFGMALMSLSQAGTELSSRQTLLVERALDIARGGSGRVEPGAAPDDGGMPT